MNTWVEINPQRIKYLQKLFNLKDDVFLSLISKGLARPLSKNDIFKDEIKLSHLKRVDKIFEKGLSFYTDPTDLKESSNASIFFRKNEFNSNLELGDYQLIDKMESRIHYLSALCKLSDISLERKFSTYSVSDDPNVVANEVKKSLYPQKKCRDDKKFLEKLIENFADYNIMVLEFVETHNKKHKTTFNGLFIQPNTIAIKRQSGSLKREIFTLVHELGHYLLNIEEIDNISFSKNNLSDIEKWCDSFAFAFLLGIKFEELSQKFHKNPTALNREILEISHKYHISRLALFTNLFLKKEITWQKYSSLKKDIDLQYTKQKEQRDLENRRKKEAGVKVRGGVSKAMYSPLEKDIFAIAYNDNVVSEYEVLKHFNEKKKAIDEFIYS